MNYDNLILRGEFPTDHEKMMTDIVHILEEGNSIEGLEPYTEGMLYYKLFLGVLYDLYHGEETEEVMQGNASWVQGISDNDPLLDNVASETYIGEIPMESKVKEVKGIYAEFIHGEGDQTIIYSSGGQGERAYTTIELFDDRAKMYISDTQSKAVVQKIRLTRTTKIENEEDMEDDGISYFARVSETYVVLLNRKYDPLLDETTFWIEYQRVGSSVRIVKEIAELEVRESTIIGQLYRPIIQEDGELYYSDNKDLVLVKRGTMLDLVNVITKSEEPSKRVSKIAGSYFVEYVDKWFKSMRGELYTFHRYTGFLRNGDKEIH